MTIPKLFTLFVLVPLFSIGCTTTPDAASNIADKVEEETYIPKDLNECFSQLKKLMLSEDIEYLISIPEDDMSLYHFSLGFWIRNNWGLWGGSQLAQWFNEIGIFHPDDMSGIILTSFWRFQNNQPIKLGDQIKFYQDYWANLDERGFEMDLSTDHCTIELTEVGRRASFSATSVFLIETDELGEVISWETVKLPEIVPKCVNMEGFKDCVEDWILGPFKTYRLVFTCGTTGEALKDWTVHITDNEDCNIRLVLPRGRGKAI